jgi:xanthine dehydrogenase YagR molybdenum-binding subunit
VARLIRTEKEVEGRYEEVFIVVEEDALEQWPAGPREIVGQPATRIDGAERARGEAEGCG